MSYFPNNPNGNTTAANSAPVTLASDTNGPVTSLNKNLEVSFSTTTAQAVASTDVSNYRSVSVHITGQGGSSTVTFQASNDNANWVSTILTNNGAGSTQATMATSTSSAGVIYSGALTARYFRLNVTGIASGTTAGVVEFSGMPSTPTGITVTNTSGSNVGVGASQTGTWTVQPGNTANTTAWLMAGGKTNNNAAPGATNLGALGAIANAAAPTWTEGNLVGLSTDLSGNQRTLMTGGLMPTGTTLNTYSIHITSNTTTTPTSSTAYISSIAISSEAGGTTSTITIQDKQGTPLKLINGFATTAVTTTPTTITFQTPVKMVSGIDIITAGAGAATIDVWVNYYQ